MPIKYNLGMDDNKLLIDPVTADLVREYIPERSTLLRLEDLFNALADLTRIRILSALSISPMCVTDLAIMLGLNQTTLSHQLKTLRSVGAVDYRRQGKISFYHICDDKLLDVMLSASKCI